MVGRCHRPGGLQEDVTSRMPRLLLHFPARGAGCCALLPLYSPVPWGELEESGRGPAGGVSTCWDGAWLVPSQIAGERALAAEGPEALWPRVPVHLGTSDCGAVTGGSEPKVAPCALSPRC